MIISTLIYVLAVLGANYTATWFFHFPGFGQVALGTFIFGVTFTQRDRLHHLGRRHVYGAIALAACLNLVMSAWLEVPLRIILASFTAILLAESVDTEIYQRLLNRSWMLRVAGSNAISIPLDTLLFTVIAFLGVMTPLEMLSILVGETVIKYAIGGVTALYRGKQVEQWESSRS